MMNANCIADVLLSSFQMNNLNSLMLLQLDGGFSREESTFLYPPMGSSFEGHYSKNASGRQLDTMGDFKFNKPRSLNIDGLGE